MSIHEAEEAEHVAEDKEIVLTAYANLMCTLSVFNVTFNNIITFYMIYGGICFKLMSRLIYLIFGNIRQTMLHPLFVLRET